MTEGTIAHGFVDLEKYMGATIPNSEGTYLYDPVMVPDTEGTVACVGYYRV